MTSRKIPIASPKVDADGDAYAFVVLVRYAGGEVWSASSVHRDAAQAHGVAMVQHGRVMRLPYYDGVPRDPEEHPDATPPGHDGEDLGAENARLRAEVERREQEYQRLYAQRDRIHAMHLDARAEMERLQGVCREAAQRLRSLSSAPNHGPKSVLDHVADLEQDALTREGGE